MFTKEINETGFSIMPDVLTSDECNQLKAMYYQDQYYRKTISLERYRFGKGEYKYYTYPLPIIIETLRHHFYSVLSPLANQWMQILKIDQQYPESLNSFLQYCHLRGQTKATALILEYK